MKRIVSYYIEERLTGLARPMSAALCSAALLVAAAAMCLPSCTNEPIFATIENEIELRDPNLEGTVPSLVQYEDSSGNHWLYACNGYLKRKEGSASPGSWSTVSGTPGRCGKIVAIDREGVFALIQNSDWSNGVVYKYDGSSWDSVGLPSGVSYIHEIGPSTSGFYAIVHTGSAAEDNVSTEFTVYEYNGASWTELSGSLDSAPIGMGGNYIVTKRRAYEVSGSAFSEIPAGGVYVSGYGNLVPGNEYDIAGMCVNPQTPTHLYVLTDDYLWHYNGSAWTGRTGTGTSSYDGFGAPAYWDNPSGGNDLVLMPLEEGYREAIIGSSGTISGTQTVGTSSLSSVATSSRSQYLSSIDDYAINFMFAVTNSNYLPSGCSYAVYASIGHYKYSGLWAYYDSVQQEWNRE